MSQEIKITRVEKSNVDSLDFDNIPFGKIFTDHMYEAHFENGKWGQFAIKPLENLSVHPGNLAWHYGQSIFEGMKATKGKDGAPLLFRPEEHIYRLNASAERMCMPTFPEAAFLDAIHTIVKMEEAWIPPAAYDQIMWLDAKEHKYVQEVGTMNIFFVMDGKVVTPITEGTILKGITRKTIIELLEEKGYEVEQRRINIDEIVECYNAGKLSEVFGTGTAAVIANVSKFKYKDTVMDFDQADATVSAYAKATINGLRDQSIEDTHGWVIEAGTYEMA